MQKQIISMLAAAACIAAMPHMGFAAAMSNPFIDVPKTEWSYQAVADLAEHGILQKDDVKLNSDHLLTRYEMAVLTAKALGKENQVEAAQKAEIEKLAEEYRNELQLVGVRLSTTEAAVPKEEKIQYYGYLGFRYNQAKQGDNNTTVMAAHFDGNISLKVDDKTRVTYEIIHHKALNDASKGDDSYTSSAQLYVNTREIKNLNITAGQFNMTPGYGMVVCANDYQGAHVRGLQIDFGGKKLTGSLFGGNTEGTYGSYNYGTYWMAEADYKISSQANMKLAYHYFKPDSNSYSTLSADGSSVKFWELGFDTKIGKDFLLQAAVDQSTAGSDNRGYFAQVMYKQSLFYAVPHTYDVFLSYHNTPVNSTINGGLLSDFYGGVSYDFRGWVYGVHYTPVRMQQITAFCMNGKTISTGDYERVYRLQYDFFF